MILYVGYGFGELDEIFNFDSVELAHQKFTDMRYRRLLQWSPPSDFESQGPWYHKSLSETLDQRIKFRTELLAAGRSVRPLFIIQKIITTCDNVLQFLNGEFPSINEAIYYKWDNNNQPVLIGSKIISPTYV